MPSDTLRIHPTPGPHQIRPDVPFWAPEKGSGPVYQERGKVPGCLTPSIHDAMTFATRAQCQEWIATTAAAVGFEAREHIVVSPGSDIPAPPEARTASAALPPCHVPGCEARGPHTGHVVKLTVYGAAERYRGGSDAEWRRKRDAAKAALLSAFGEVRARLAAAKERLSEPCDHEEAAKEAEARVEELQALVADARRNADDARAQHLDACRERDEARRAASEMREALGRLEWSFRQTALRNGGTIYTASLCPVCMGEKDPPDDKGSRRKRGDPLPPAGHKPDCWLRALLAAPTTTKETTDAR